MEKPTRKTAMTMPSASIARSSGSSAVEMRWICQVSTAATSAATAARRNALWAVDK